MRRRSPIGPTAWVAAWFLALATAAAAQDAEVVLVPTPAPEVTLMRPDADGMDPRLAQRLALQPGGPSPYLVVLETSEPLKGLTVVWTFTNAGGVATTRYASRTHLYLDIPTSMVANPGMQIPLAPGAFPGVPANLAADSELLEAISNARTVTLELDTVIFADGRVRGPDRSRTLLNLELRHEATRSFIADVREAFGAGNVDAVIDEMAALSPALEVEATWNDQLIATIGLGREDLYDFWLSRVARATQGSASAPLQVADRLETIPSLPNFVGQSPEPE